MKWVSPGFLCIILLGLLGPATSSGKSCWPQLRQLILRRQHPANAIEQQLANANQHNYHRQRRLRRIRQARQYLTFSFKGIPRGRHLRGGEGFFGQFWRMGTGLAHDWVVPTAHFLKPLPVPSSWGRGPSYPIFKKLWDNPHYLPTSDERALLQTYNSLDYYFDLARFYSRHPRQHWVRKKIYTSAIMARHLSMAAMGYSLYEQMQGGLLSYEEYMRAEQYRLQENQIQIITEMAPLPHTAIRIGSLVFSYGQTHMTVLPLSLYLQSTQYRTAASNALAREREQEQGPNIQTTRSWLAEATETIHIPRSIQVVTLNLSQAEREKLKAHLVQQTGKRYAYRAFAIDCTSMVIRALAQVLEVPHAAVSTRLFDASPGQTNLVLTLLDLFSERRGPVYQVILEGEPNHLSHLLRNSYLNLLDSYIFIQFFIGSQARRLYADSQLSEAELQYHEESFFEFLEQAKKDFDEMVDSEREIRFLRHDIEQFIQREPSLSSAEAARQRQDLQRSIDYHFARKIAYSQSIIQSSNSPQLMTILQHDTAWPAWKSCKKN